MSENNNKELEYFLRTATKTGKWKEVVEKYKNHPEAQKLKLNRQSNTTLHLAVIDNREDTVERLVELICKEHLQTANENGNNPLHLAAMMGSVRMCLAIASAEEKLVHERNKAGETPLFLAASYGNKDAFYCLYYFCRNDASKITSNCRANNGDTVLHCALRNEQFDLAFQFIDKNQDAMNWVTSEGLTPLHVLASKPTCFRSGSGIKGWRNFLYHCTFVDQLKPKSIETLHKELEQKMLKEKQNMSKAKTTTPPFPDKYDTCVDFFSRLKYIFLTVFPLKRRNKKDKDLEKHVDEERQNIARELPSTNFPRIYTTCFDLFHFIFLAILIIFGFGFTKVKRIRKKKEKHTWSVQVMEKLIESAEPDKYGDDGKTPMDSKFQTAGKTGETGKVTHPYDLIGDKVQVSDDVLDDTQSDSEEPKHDKPKHDKPKNDEPKNDEPKHDIETVMLLAAKNGVIEIVRAMFKRFPLAIRDARTDKKNVVHLAAEYRQPDVYRFLLKQKDRILSQFRALDDEGNSALHLAAGSIDTRPWHITGAALQMQWEIKWFQYVEESVPLHFFGRYNNEGKTASAIFDKTHMKLVKEGGEWLYQTSESCSLVATLIATVAFATAVSIPGGSDDHGSAKLEKEQSFFIFSISSLIALCLSSTSVIVFLAILTSRFKTDDFRLILPWKLLIGLSCLYFSIIAMLVSFCSGHYFLIIHRLHNNAVLLYTLTCLPVALIFGIAQLPLYFDLLQSILKRVPKRSSGVVLTNQLVLYSPRKNSA